MAKLIRLDKLLADSGKGTRSQVKEYIKKGRITVNDTTAKAPDQKVNPDTDKVCFDGTSICYEEFSYYMLNKPAGVVSATEDKREKTVIDLITGDKPRDLFPVGRLDKDTEGLLLITNDGKLANDLLSPKKHVDKTYYAKVVVLEREGDGKIISETAISQFAEGVDIGDEKLTKPAKLEVLSQDEEEAEILITITEGRYHQVKRMFEAIGRKVVYLKRLSMGSLSLDEKLDVGEYRKLTSEEVLMITIAKKPIQ